MNKDTLHGHWTELKGSIQEQWGKLTDDDLDQIQGRHDQLVGKIEQRYGKARAQVEKEVDAFLDKHSPAKKPAKK